MQTTARAVIAAYPRDPSQSLTLLAPWAPGVAPRRRRWASYLTGDQTDEAPLATRFVSLLAEAGDEEGGEEGGDVAWPATLYPHGFRRQVMRHCGLASETEPDVRTGGRLRTALTWNSMSLYRKTVEAFGRYARSVRVEPHLTYEVTRAAYQVDPARAVQAFAALSTPECPSAAIRLNAASRLVAHYARRSDDLDACGHWTRVSTTMAAEIGTASDFAIPLAVSRVYRAAALYHSRRRDAAAVTRTLQAAAAANEAAVPLAGTDLRRLELAQNERLIHEAALKAFVATAGRLDPFGADRSADRLTGLDPWDPYTRLTVGDARWILGADEQALASYDVAASMGSLAGAIAAHHGAVVCARTGRRVEAGRWLARAVELDPAATVAELSGD
jgi:hypothetical protein